MCPAWSFLPGTVSAILYLAKPSEHTLPSEVCVNSNSEETPEPARIYVSSPVREYILGDREMF